jgi:hypothetical protein
VPVVVVGCQYTECSSTSCWTVWVVVHSSRTLLALVQLLYVTSPCHTETRNTPVGDRQRARRRPAAARATWSSWWVAEQEQQQQHQQRQQQQQQQEQEEQEEHEPRPRAPPPPLAPRPDPPPHPATHRSPRRSISMLRGVYCILYAWLPLREGRDWAAGRVYTPSQVPQWWRAAPSGSLAPLTCYPRLRRLAHLGAEVAGVEGMRFRSHPSGPFSRLQPSPSTTEHRGCAKASGGEGVI